MNFSEYRLPTPEGAPRRLARLWLWLALLSLSGSGLVLILVLLAQTPLIHTWVPWIGSFPTALVIHVDLSVLVWFLSFAGVLASLTLHGEGAHLGQKALILASVGAGLLFASPFLGSGEPFLNNYIPVLNSAPFFIGLALFIAGFSTMCFHALNNARPRPAWRSHAGVMQFAITSALIIGLLSVASWVGVLPLLEPPRDKEYFETLFWGGGHILQFTHVQLMILAWLWLGAEAGVESKWLTPTVVFVALALTAAAVLYAPIISLRYEPASAAYKLAYTWLMRDGNGIAAVVVGPLLFLSAWRTTSTKENSPFRTALILSILLFGLGGAMGFLISGINTTIPAHYHGSILSITVAYMGLTYLLIPRLGRGTVSPKWANRQLILFGVGQTLHVIGLFWAGGHGVQRKTAGAAHELGALQAELPGAIKSLGGGLTVIAGIFFLILAIRALRTRPTG